MNKNNSLSQDVEQSFAKASRMAKSTGKIIKNVVSGNYVGAVIAAAKNKSFAKTLCILIASLVFIQIYALSFPSTVFGRLCDNPIIEVADINALGAGGASADEACYYNMVEAQADANQSVLHDVLTISERVKKRAEDIENEIPVNQIKQECESIFEEKVKEEHKEKTGSETLNTVAEITEDDGLISGYRDMQEVRWDGATVNINTEDTITYHQALRILAAYNAQTTGYSHVFENGETDYDLKKMSLPLWLGDEASIFGGTAGEQKRISFKIAGHDCEVDSWVGKFLPQYLFEQREQDIANRPSDIQDAEAIKTYNDEVAKSYEENMCSLIDLIMLVSGPSSLESCVRIDEIQEEEVVGKTQHHELQNVTKTETEEVSVYYDINDRITTISDNEYNVGDLFKVNGEVKGVICKCEWNNTESQYDIAYYRVCYADNTNAEETTVAETKEITTTEDNIVDGSETYTKTTYVGSATVNINITTRDFDEIARNIGFWCGDKDQAQSASLWAATLGSAYNGSLSGNDGKMKDIKMLLKDADKAKLIMGYDYGYVVRYISENCGIDAVQAKALAITIQTEARKAGMDPDEYVLATYDNGNRNNRNDVKVKDSIWSACYEGLGAEEKVNELKERLKNPEAAKEIMGYDYVHVVQVVAGEIGAENEENQRAVAQVIINRAKRNKQNPYQVVTAKNQFDANNHISGYPNENFYEEFKRTWDICFDMFVLGNEFSEVKDAYFFYSSAGGFTSAEHESHRYITQYKLQYEGPNAYHIFFAYD